jgi:hypothetical protein
MILGLCCGVCGAGSILDRREEHAGAVENRDSIREALEQAAIARLT